jgi:hypothetical protein
MPYGLTVDEYTDVSARKHLVLVCRYICDGVSKIAFLQDIQLSNGEADTIYKAMRGYIENTQHPSTEDDVVCK